MIKWDNIGSDRRLVIYSFTFFMLAFLAMGVLMERTVSIGDYGEYFNSESPVQVTQIADGSTNPKQLKAIVKGSIYETGSNMTVYGACFDGDGYLLPDAVGTFTAWYPNGSIHTGPNVTMEEILYDDDGTYLVNGTGRYMIHVTMGSTIGTYLTEIRCLYQGQEAWAMGEWQNPEWVQRIRDTQVQVNDTYNQLLSVSNDLNVFINDTATNFSDVLTAIDNIDVAGDLSNDLYEIRTQLEALDGNLWVLEEENPFFVLDSNVHNWAACDLLNENDVALASSDGYYATWDGYTWTENDLTSTGVEFRGISILPANVPYGWAVGGNGTDPVISINGGALTIASLPSGSPLYFNDVKLFQRPNSPAAPYYIYLLGDDGSVYFSDNTGTTWSLRATVDANDTGRFSQVVENYDIYAQPDGYVIMYGQGTDVVVDDGTTMENYTVSGQVKDVSLVFYNLGYVAVDTPAGISIYKYNGTDITVDYTINTTGLVATGLDAVSQNDVWLTTSNPAIFYHFDGRNWLYSTVAYADFVSVLINFGAFTNETQGILDLCMDDARVGYAVGSDGIILEWTSRYEQSFDAVFANLTAILNASQVNLTPILDALAAMNLTLADINLTVNDIYQMSAGNFTYINSQLTAISNQLAAMNLTLEENNALLLAINNTVTNTATTVNNINSTVNNIYSLVTDMNVTMVTELQNIDDFLASMNATLTVNIDSILSNVTYTNLYLETTIFPLLNSTYANTVLILQQLGILEGQINQTIELQNQTLQIVNDTAAGVDELVNRSRRIRAWITQ